MNKSLTNFTKFLIIAFHYSLFTIYYSFLLSGCSSPPTLKITPYQTEILTQPRQSTHISVGLTNGVSSFQVSSTKSFTILNTNGDEITTVPSPEVWTFEHVVSPDAQGPRDVWQLQLAAYKTKESADRGAETVQKVIPSDIPIHIEPIGDWYKIRVGMYPTRENAVELQKDLVEQDQYIDCFPVKVTLPATEHGHIRIRTPEGESLGFLWVGPLRVIADDDFLKFNDDPYRGEFQVGINEKGQLYLANQVTITEYLQGVLPAEMNANWHLEALKAQAVVARTYLINQLEMHLKDGFNVCNTTHCQVYQGMKGETENSNRAVQETEGEILIYEGKPIKAVYSACCGGFTEAAENVWESNGSTHYLNDHVDSDRHQSRPSGEHAWRRWIHSTPTAFCNNHITRQKDIFRWQTSRTVAEIDQSINAIAPIGTVREIIPRERGDSGRLKRITVVGTKDVIDIEGELRIRRALGNLRSSAFVVTGVERDGHPISFEFTGAGYGHGVGMCQLGAVGMAERGYHYRRILKHYYQGCRVISLLKAKLPS